MPAGKRYEPVDPKQPFLALEERILERWRERDVFARQLAEREGAPVWSSRGTPTANGRPGSHHVLARVFKDIYPPLPGDARPLRTPQGGLGTATVCRSSSRSRRSSGSPPRTDRGVRDRRVQPALPRLGVPLRRRLAPADRADRLLVDMDDPYRTLDNDYIESVWWSLRQSWDRDRLCQGHKVVPYRPRWDGAELPRGRPRVRGSGRPEHLRADAGYRPRRVGARVRRQPARLDDDAVDSDLARRDRRRA